jgi:uncharacterized protein (DUF58 family)
MRDPRWLIALSLLDVWALWLGHELLAFACTFGLLCALTVSYWLRFGLSGVSYQRALGRERAQLGETVTLTATFGNHKLLPLSALEIYDALPRHVKLSGGTQRDNDAGLPCLYIARAMLPYTRITRHLHVRCERRGVFQFGPVRYQAGDFLGVARQHGGDNTQHELLVLPKIFKLDLGALASRQLLGRQAAQNHLPDPLRKLGAREYRSGDPLRTIDWRATARRSSLMVREIEPSSSPALQIILSFRIHAHSADWVEPDELEFAISLAASIAAYASARGMAVGLSGNGLAQGKPLALPASRAPQQLSRVLELLAHAASRPTGPLAALLQARELSRERTSTWLVIADQLDASEQALLRDAQRRGRAVVVLLTGRAQPMSPVRVLRAPYREGWAVRDAITLAV